MAKVSFTKLGLIKNQEVKNIKWGEYEIEVKQYLPINDKLTLISNVINASHDEQNYSNPIKIDIFTVLEVMYAYTNINFTEKQKEDIAKLYDLIVSSGLYAAVVDAIPVSEHGALVCGIHKSIDAIYAYQNSVMGVLETVSTDYSNLNLDAQNIQRALGDSENLTFLKDVITKLG